MRLKKLRGLLAARPANFVKAGSDYVSYVVFHHNKVESQADNRACYANQIPHLHDTAYKVLCIPNKKYKNQCTLKMMELVLDRAKTAGFIETEVYVYEYNKDVFMMVPGGCRHRSYTALCLYRNMESNPAFIWDLYTILTNSKTNFYQALYYACKTHCSHSGHSFNAITNTAYSNDHKIDFAEALATAYMFSGLKDKNENMIEYAKNNYQTNSAISSLGYSNRNNKFKFGNIQKAFQKIDIPFTKEAKNDKSLNTLTKILSFKYDCLFDFVSKNIDENNIADLGEKIQTMIDEKKKEKAEKEAKKEVKKPKKGKKKAKEPENVVGQDKDLNPENIAVEVNIVENPNPVFEHVVGGDVVVDVNVVENPVVEGAVA